MTDPLYPVVGTEQDLYNCVPEANLTCPYECESLENCDECGCVVVDSGGGPWGKAMDVILCLLPIFFLLVATLKPKPLPTTTSLPMAALIMFLVRTMYLGSDPLLCSACIISGIHEALSPITIMGGAILLFETMEATLCMPFMMREMKYLTKGHNIAELMLLFGFAYMIEGASGFGTPVALGAPMLVSLGYPKFESVVTLLLMNTFATVWGAAGTPIWFGFGNLDLSQDEFIEISYKAGVALAFAAYLLLPFVIHLTCTWKSIGHNWLFFLLSTTCTVGPSLGLSFVAYEFPSLIGGMIGCCLTSVLIFKNVGLKPIEKISEKDESMTKEGGGDDDGEVEEAQSEDKMDGNGESTSAGSAVVADPTVANDNGSSVKASSKTDTNVDESKITTKSSDPSSSASFSKDKDEEQGISAQSLKNSALAIEMQLGERKKVGEGYIKEVILRTFPLWGTVLILIITRVPQIGLRDLLTRKEPSFSIFFQTYGTFKCSASLVLQLENILTYPNLNWKYELLYVPCKYFFTVLLIGMSETFPNNASFRRLYRQVSFPLRSSLSSPCSSFEKICNRVRVRFLESSLDVSRNLPLPCLVP